MVALLYCDLDHFKRVNDQHGHAAGDKLLAAVAENLRALVRPEDTVARFGGDEFVILCEDLSAPDDGHALARRIEQAVRRHYPSAAPTPASGCRSASP